MGILSGNPQNELRYITEKYLFGSYLLAAQGAIASHQMFMNHTNLTKI